MPAKRRATEEADEQGDTASEARLASCDSCKSRKLKCDRAQPSCNRCQRSSTECVYNERKRPGFQAGFRQSMEERIGLLEQEVQLLKTQRSTPSVTTLERGNTVITTSSGTSQSLPSRVENAQAFDSIPWTRTRDVIERCPPPDLVYSLISLYFRHIHPWFPVLCPKRVFGSFANPESVEEPSLLQYAIFGITLVFSNDPRLDMAATDSYWKYCKRKIMLAMLEDPSYEALEALVILTLDLSGMTNGPQVWGVQAVIVNLSVQLGLADENSSAIMNVANGVSPPADENLRRRLFWGIYMIDRYISMTTPHPCRLDEKIIHRWLPGQKPPNAPPTSNSSSQQITSTFGDNIDQFDQRLRLMDLTSKIHNVNLQFTSLAANDSPAMWVAEAHKQNEALSQWFNYLPQRFCLRQDSPTEWNSAPWDPGFMMLHAGYHSLIVYLNAPLAYPFHQNHVTSSSEPALYRALNSTQMLGRILTTAQEKGFMNMLGWPFAWTLWNACRFLLIHEYRTKTLFSPLFRQLHAGLQDLARFWQISGKYWRLLGRAVEDIEAVLNGRALTSRPQLTSALVGVTDLRIAPSDLVAQFGARASVGSAEETLQQVKIASPENPITTDDSSYDPSLGAGGFVDQSYFPYQSQPIYDWFNAPLHPTSGYQQGS